LPTCSPPRCFTGTPYDLTQGLEAGPYGDPSRWDNALNDNMTRVELLSGGFERCVLCRDVVCALCCRMSSVVGGDGYRHVSCYVMCLSALGARVIVVVFLYEKSTRMRMS
jgi:hypothetical protein